MSDQADTTETETEEVEIVLETGEEQPTHQLPKGIARRIGKLTERNKESSAEVERLKRENEALLLAQKVPPARPKREDFATDDAYDAARDDYVVQQTAAKADEVVAKRLGEGQESQQIAQRQRAAEAAYNAHYERAESLGVSDYSEAEARAIEILGESRAGEIIAALDRSEVVMYHLGKNPAKAEHIRDLINSNPVKGTIAIGALEAQLKVQPKKKQEIEPEATVAGGSPGPSSDALDKALDAVTQATSDRERSRLMDEYRRLRREARQ